MRRATGWLLLALFLGWCVQVVSPDLGRLAAGLPRLQVAHIGGVSTDYGDYFVAGLVGGILAAERRPQAVLAVATLAVAEAWNQLFLVVDSLPGTVPPCLVLLASEAWQRRRAKVAA